MTTLSISGLTVEFQLPTYVIKPVDNLSAEGLDGELILLLGPSGSGKSTLLSCLAGLLQPTSGTVMLNDKEVTALKGGDVAAYRRNDVGVIFQAFNLIPSLTARENIMAPLRLAGVSRKEATGRADELLERVGLGDRATALPGRLSGGQQQRVAIARALVVDPQLILADEPTAHLDYIQVEQIIQMIRELASPGRVVIVATHDERFSPLADRVIELGERLAKEQEPYEVEFAAGEVIFNQGDFSDVIYVVEDGVVDIYREQEDGAEEQLASIEKGQVFGELGVMLRHPRSASARASTKVTLTAYGLLAFRRWNAEHGSQ